MNIGAGRWKLKRWLWVLAFLGAATALCFVAYSLRVQRRAFAERTHCVGNLVHLRLAKSMCQEDLRLADGDPVPDQALNRALVKYLSKPLALYRCPSGGTYLVGNAGAAPRCSYTNTCYTYDFDILGLRVQRRTWTHTLGP